MQPMQPFHPAGAVCLAAASRQLAPTQHRLRLMLKPQRLASCRSSTPSPGMSGSASRSARPSSLQSQSLSRQRRTASQHSLPRPCGPAGGQADRQAAAPVGMCLSQWGHICMQPGGGPSRGAQPCMRRAALPCPGSSAHLRALRIAQQALQAGACIARAVAAVALVGPAVAGQRQPPGRQQRRVEGDEVVGVGAHPGGRAAVRARHRQQRAQQRRVLGADGLAERQACGRAAFGCR